MILSSHHLEVKQTGCGSLKGAGGGIRTLPPVEISPETFPRFIFMNQVLPGPLKILLYAHACAGGIEHVLTRNTRANYP